MDERCKECKNVIEGEELKCSLDKCAFEEKEKVVTEKELRKKVAEAVKSNQELVLKDIELRLLQKILRERNRDVER